MSIARILAAALAVAVILPIGAQASTLTEQALCDAKAEQAYKKLLLVQQLSKPPATPVTMTRKINCASWEWRPTQRPV